MIKDLIKQWQIILGIDEWEIDTQRIDASQIMYDDQDYFIGIERRFNNQTATIYHDIDLYEEAIVHELLHIKHRRIPGTTFEKYEQFICWKTEEYLREFK